MKKILIVLGVVLVGSVAYYALSPLWRNVKVDEAKPGTQSAEQTQQMMQEERGTVEMKAPVIGTLGHPAMGDAYIVEAGGKKYVRFENFKTINGPDIFVYLSKDKEAKDYVDLGAVKATAGNINYEIPGNVNPSDYRYIMTWCKQFGVLFNYADLKPQH